MIIGAIEGGGTKFICGLLEADGQDYSRPTVLAKTSIPTTSPEATLKASLDFFQAACAERQLSRLDGVGIGSFGPVDLRPTSPTWGFITATPKPGWKNAEVAGYFRDKLDVPVAFDTDVNAAAYGEYLWGAARDFKDFIYMTVGTGIGGGIFSNGSLIHGLQHPELGHIRVPRHHGDNYSGCCPFHGDCLEGMASGPAIGKRWGVPAENLPEGHEAWELEARYLAKACATFALVLSPGRILLGGGVGLRPGLAERVSDLVGEELAGYLVNLADPGRLKNFVVRPQLGSEAGLLGSAALVLRYCSP